MKPIKIRMVRDGVRIGRLFTSLKEGEEYDVIEPPADKKRQFPNNDESCWVMGATEPVRLFTKGRGKDAVITKFSE